MPQYSVNNLTVDSVIGFIKNKEIAIPEIQRPFVWKSDQIRDLIDSLYNGYPIGYLIIWQNPDTADLHHIFPQQYLKDCGFNTTLVYNQIANYAYLSRPVNIAVGKKAPKIYLGEVINAIEQGQEDFLATRRKLMAQKVRNYFESL